MQPLASPLPPGEGPGVRLKVFLSRTLPSRRCGLQTSVGSPREIQFPSPLPSPGGRGGILVFLRLSKLPGPHVINGHPDFSDTL